MKIVIDMNRRERARHHMREYPVLVTGTFSRLNDGRTAQSVVAVAPHDPLRTAVT
jgi:hypothetical protein